MSPHSLFTYANLAAMVGWVCLAALPNAHFTKKLVNRGGIPLGLSVLYALAIFNGSHMFSQGGSFETLTGVRILFSNSWMLLAGWVHYLAFDLWIGGEVSSSMQSRGFSHPIRIAVLLAVFLFGPIGFIAYHFLTNRSK